MLATEFVLTLILLAVPVTAPQTAPTPNPPAAPVSQTAADQGATEKLHQSAMKFVEAADARQRMELTLDKLLQDGEQAMMTKNPGLDPQFADEWLKRMRVRVNLDQFVLATAQVYEKYFTRDELEELAEAQLALKKSQAHPISPQVAEKMKSNSPFIQRDINTETSRIGGRLGSEVGKEIERDHPEWVKPPAPAPAAAAGTKRTGHHTVLHPQATADQK
jgi:hypothetical protein